MTHAAPPFLTWRGIVRLGLVQTGLGAIFVLSTATLNRVMTVELGLPAILPGLLIALQYWVQVLRPRLGHRADGGARRTPHILGGMVVLAAGGMLAAAATGLMVRHLAAGLALAAVAFATIGVGVSAAGTNLLVLLAARTAPARRPAAATVAWLMMIAGFVVTAAVAGRLLDPFSPGRLVAVAAIVAASGLLVSGLALRGVEGSAPAPRATVRQEGGQEDGQVAFREALREVWADARARRFATFVFVSMLAYGGEELMVEPFAGALFALSPGATARLSGALHAGSLGGMVLVALVCGTLGRSPVGSLRGWMVGGCLLSGAALVGLAVDGLVGARAPLPMLVFALGMANGAYAIAAIATMMQLVGSGARQGVRMGLWGAAQGVAFGCGSLGATALNDVARVLGAWQAVSYAAVFLAQAATFALAATLVITRDLGRTPRVVAGTPAAPALHGG